MRIAAVIENSIAMIRGKVLVSCLLEVIYRCVILGSFFFRWKDVIPNPENRAVVAPKTPKGISGITNDKRGAASVALRA
jgi:hypothetical protein